MSHKRDQIFINANTVESDIGITPGFLERLLDEQDDWSFVIKVHALAGAALTYLLTTAVGREELGDLFDSLTMGDARKGKLAIAESLRLLDPRRVVFLRALGRIRNRFAHDVKYAGFRIEDYARLLPLVDQKKLWQDLIRGYTIEPFIFDFDNCQVRSEDFARARPRFTIWIGSLSTLSLIYRAKTSNEVDRQKMFSFLKTMKPVGDIPPP